MGLFSRKPKTPLPDNVGTLLADWGQREFDRRAHPDICQDTDEFIGYIEYRRLPTEDEPEWLEGIRAAGLREGGWSAYGAWEVLSAYFEAPQAILDELSEARIRFLLSLDRPDLDLYLNIDDSITLKRIDPAAYGRFSSL